MKPKFLLIGMISSLALAACDEKKVAASTPTVGKDATHPEKRLRPTSMVPDPRPSASTSGVEIPAAEAAEAQNETIQPATILPVTPPPGETAEEIAARRAAARAQRVAQNTTRITADLSKRDTNGDGILAKDEVSGRMQRGFVGADKNADGYLDAAEQQAMAQDMAQRMSERGGGRGNRRGGGGGGFGGGGGGEGGEGDYRGLYQAFGGGGGRNRNRNP